MRVTALAGGVGAAKLLTGLQRTAGADLTAIVNTGDDDEIYGLHVSPDVDIVTYWLAGVADTERGWGIRGDTFTVVESLRDLGAETWFRLGDRDLATCLFRTERLRAGATLSTVTGEIRQRLGVSARVLPMSDDPVRTKLVTADGATLGFQEYFVKHRTKPRIGGVHYSGAAEATPGPGVVAAIERAERVIVAPSNPVLSVGPILAVPGVRQALVAHPCVMAITPIIKGAALKGPADKLLESLTGEASASAVARLYADFCDLFVVDRSDDGETERVRASGTRAITLDTVMSDHRASERLAREIVGAPI